MNVKDTVVSFVLIPPIGHAVGVLIDIKTVDQRIAVGIDVPVVAAVVGRPASVKEPVELRHGTGRHRVGGGVIAVVVEHNIGEGIVPKHHVPVVGGVGSVELAVGRAVQHTAVVHRVVGGREGVGSVVIDNAAVPVVGVVQIGNAIVVVVPVNAVLKTITVHVGVHVVGSVVAIQTAVDLMEVVVVVEITIPVDVQGVDDAVVVVVDVVPVADAVAVPVVELRERGAAGLTARIWVRWVRVGLRWTVPCKNVGSGVERERIVLVLDVVIVKVVGKVCTTHGEVAKVVGGLRTAHVDIEPVVNAVVVLVERTHKVVVKIVVVVDFTIDVAVQVAVFTGDFEIHSGRAAHGHLSVGCTTGDGQDVA